MVSTVLIVIAMVCFLAALLWDGRAGWLGIFLLALLLLLRR